MMGSGVHGDFEHAEVAAFVGKSAWHRSVPARIERVDGLRAAA